MAVNIKKLLKMVVKKNESHNFFYFQWRTTRRYYSTGELQAIRQNSCEQTYI